MSTTCSHCGTNFEPQRHTARFCRPACRVAAHRQVGCNANKAALSLTEPVPASQNTFRAHPKGLGPKAQRRRGRVLALHHRLPSSLTANGPTYIG